jgi:hypothetical protein
VHREDLTPEDITVHEGMPRATIAKTVADLLKSGERVDLIRQAISDSRREAFVQESEARQVRRRVEDHVKSLRDVRKQIEPGITWFRSEIARARPHIPGRSHGTQQSASHEDEAFPLQ